MGAARPPQQLILVHSRHVPHQFSFQTCELRFHFHRRLELLALAGGTPAELKPADGVSSRMSLCPPSPAQLLSGSTSSSPSCAYSMLWRIQHAKNTWWMFSSVR